VSLSRFPHFLPLAAVCSMVVLSPGQAQKTDLEVGYGLWWSDSVSVVYSVSIHRALLGPIDYGVGATHLQGPAGVDQKRVTGGEVSLGLWRDGAGPYLLGAAGLGMSHSSGDFDAQWSAGGGYNVRLLNFLSMGLEARFRVADQASRGFWRLHPDDDRGVILQAHVTIGSSGRRRGAPRAAGSRPPVSYPVRPAEPTSLPGPDLDTPGEIAALRSAVVETAIEVMGKSYRWGGEGEGGFDCSGLIQYAYGEHGLILPRTSRDQARMGLQVDRLVASLRPGDILGFSDGGGGITHVGLYVGDGMFIHSSSSGVKLSDLTSGEGDGRWWQQRWVLARRLIN
jgi:cell wall-associated NlpC family hydrolase